MQLFNKNEFIDYIKSNYEEYFKHEDLDGEESLITASCDSCNRPVHLKLKETWYHSKKQYLVYEGIAFCTFLVQCPKCQRYAFIKTIRIEENRQAQSVLLPETIENSTKYYKLIRIPVNEESPVIESIPDEPKTLRETLSEANFCLEHSKYTSAVIMFRRCLDIIAKHILGAEGRTLGFKLQWLEKNPNKLGINLSKTFLENSKIVKEIGDQGAHADDDEKLHYFSAEEAYATYDLFISIVHEVFVVPQREEETRKLLLNSRKIKI